MYRDGIYYQYYDHDVFQQKLQLTRNQGTLGLCWD